MTVEQFASRVRAAVNAKLASLVEPLPGADPPPPRIAQALRYALQGGGKRFRPMLVIASGEACAPSDARAGTMTEADIPDLLLVAACAIEMIHTFSLIHDDLPALDNDDLRRGRPTLHVQYDEATAILAGDALLNLSYEVMARGEGMAPERLRAIAAISRAVGLEGMISGQVLDIQGQGAQVDSGTLRRTHALKTGALIRVSCEVGGIVSGAQEAALRRLREYGGHLGLAFQIVDDILDVEGSAAVLGKSPGKDAAAFKATYPAVWGLEESRRRAAECVDQACAAVSGDGLRADRLEVLARGVLTRKR